MSENFLKALTETLDFAQSVRTKRQCKVCGTNLVGEYDPETDDGDEHHCSDACLIKGLYARIDLLKATVDCDQCDNRGKPDGLSQESHCEHCIYGTPHKTDHFKPKEQS